NNLIVCKFPAAPFCAARDRRQDQAAARSTSGRVLTPTPYRRLSAPTPGTGANRSQTVRPPYLTRPRSFRNDIHRAPSGAIATRHLCTRSVMGQPPAADVSSRVLGADRVDPHRVHARPSGREQALPTTEGQVGHVLWKV